MAKRILTTADVKNPEVTEETGKRKIIGTSRDSIQHGEKIEVDCAGGDIDVEYDMEKRTFSKPASKSITTTDMHEGRLGKVVDVLKPVPVDDVIIDPAHPIIPMNIKLTNAPKPKKTAARKPRKKRKKTTTKTPAKPAPKKVEPKAPEKEAPKKEVDETEKIDK